MRRTILIIMLTACAGVAGAQEFIRILPAAASAPGVGDSFFVTDVRLYNPSASETITVRAAFLRRDRDNTGASEVSVDLAPRTGVRYADVLADLFGTDGAGGVAFRSDRPFLVTSRTFNAGGDAGTFGQYIPGQTPDDALERGILLSVSNDPTASGFRANVGFANPSGAPVEVTVRVYDATRRSLLGETSRTLPPLAVSQINDVFRAVGAADRVIRNAAVEFVATAAVLAYASVLDNVSDDPIYVLPFADAGSPMGANRAPDGVILQPAGDVTVAVGQPVAFEGAASDPDGDDVTVVWDFGDGRTSTDLVPGEISYDDAGAYTVTFTATDENGVADPEPGTRTITVEAGNGPPAGMIVTPADDVAVTVGETIEFSGTGVDPDGDEVTAEWDFGDGATATGLDVQHSYGAAGTYTVTLTVTDDRGLSDPDPPTRTVSVSEAVAFSEIQTRIFDQSCAFSGCHGNGSASAGMNLDAGNAYGNIVGVPSTEVPSLDRVEPGDPDASYLYLKVTGDPSIVGGRMPLGGPPLPQDLIDLLRGWIEVGAPDD